MGIGFDSALSKAKEYLDQVDYVCEYSDAYVFSKKDDESLGGPGPVVVLKEDGKVINYVAYITSDATPLIDEGHLDGRTTS